VQRLVPTSMKKTITGILAIAIILLVYAAIAYVRMASFSCSSACINNLRQVEAAKAQWALENHVTNGEVAVTSPVNQYLKGNTTPVCPQGGFYTYNPVGVDPTCSGVDTGRLGARRPHRLPKTK
jgi:hypothetical protein